MIWLGVVLMLLAGITLARMGEIVELRKFIITAILVIAQIALGYFLITEYKNFCL